MPFYAAYVWEDTDAPEAEQKFGDHWCVCDTWEQAVAETRKYVRNSLGRQKHKFDEGRIKIHMIWDVSEYAKLKNKFKKHAKIDDTIRVVIPNHVSADVHRTDATTLITAVNEELIRHKVKLPVAGLSQKQYDVAVELLEAIRHGDRTLIADLCARLGKTIWAGAMIIESKTELTIVASYVLTSFASFIKDLRSFEQFRDLVLVDTKDENYQERITEGLKEGKQVVAFLSMCNGGKRSERIKWLFSRKATRMLIVDEADYGVHRIGQVAPLKNARKPDDVVILMTGTNADKAASLWQPDYHTCVVYPELLMEKYGNGVKSKTPQILKHFKVDPSRHALVADIKMYQADLTGALEVARKHDPNLFIEDGIYLPSWSKFGANPVKAKGFFVTVLQGIFEGKHGLDQLNADFQTRSNAEMKVAMMFLPASMTNENFEIAANVAKQALRGFAVMPIYGGEGGLTNADAEKAAKEFITNAEKRGQSVLLLTRTMANRSFSISHITEIYLAYDEGEEGATIQKMARGLTPAKDDKTCHIFSLSFDPNRDDKFDQMIVISAQNYAKSKGISMADALDAVLRTVDVLSCQPNGAVKMVQNTYMEQLMTHNRLSRLIGRVANFDGISRDMIEAFAASDLKAFREAKQEAAQKGKTRLISLKKNHGAKSKDINAKVLQAAREAIVNISENLDVIIYGTNAKSLEEAFKNMSRDLTLEHGIEKRLGISVGLVKEAIACGMINKDLLSLMERRL